MAETTVLEILRKGVDAWNLWRAQRRDRVDLSGADLSGAQLLGANLIRVDLRNADLRGADLSWCNLSGANLSGASFLRADLRIAQLIEANLVRTDLREADLRGTGLSDSDLRGAKFARAKMGGTVLGNVALSETEGLDTVEHVGPSTIGVDTIYRSKGAISEVFLRGAGVTDTFITYIRSLVVKPIEYYSCFISYSSKDDDFARRLHAHLQANHVRCWFAPEDLKIGDRFRDRIEESIRIHDKLLLVLSTDSVNSPWVQTEVEAALERERRENRSVLFPIRLDNAVMETTQAWAADIRRTRHMGDFTRWKDHDGYQDGLKRLLHDLGQ